ncbi:BgTH12-06500 [Blumeria graminis f. sp. triticale]|uniref:BgTH12-06500 n=1 Tax=Blumeria graminis f. sp. triticale TaxID=1689686 RepID=A0A9W4CYC0_BLUGR|nr:BgTH12-06500 [Blumeria graminis f. sp. triticale]
MQASGDVTPLYYSLFCTLCRLQQALNVQPKAPGRLERIVCESCWRSTLDLSICWACGEYVMQSDEVVNLGLCFWHSDCFGCLLCGTRLGIPAPERRERVELERIPHCKRCEVEIEEKMQNKKFRKSYADFSKAGEGLGPNGTDIFELCGHENFEPIATSTRSKYKDVAFGPLANDDDHVSCFLSILQTSRTNFISRQTITRFQN